LAGKDVSRHGPCGPWRLRCLFHEALLLRPCGARRGPPAPGLLQAPVAALCDFPRPSHPRSPCL
jgi:hypothetical protein